MKRQICAVLLLMCLAFGLVGCSQSVIDEVTISNVEQESYRPEGYDGPTDIAGGFNWDGVIISGDITNNSNKTLRVAVVINSYVGKSKKYNRYGESNTISLDPGETKQFEYDFNYDDQGIAASWTHDISNVVKK